MAKRIQNVRLGWRVARTFDLASAAIAESTDDALEVKAQQITFRIEGSA
jgi:hypothetical protein